MSKHNVRTFRAQSPREALEQVKRELGPEAVILGTRSVPATGVGSLVRRPRVEITAAPPDTHSPAPRLTRRATPLEQRPSSDKPQLPKHVYPAYVQLVQNEVAEEIAAELARRAAADTSGEDSADGAALKRVVRDYIADMMPQDNTVDSGPDHPRRLAFVGPSGCGKTTTLAKLAARFKLEHGRQVTLLSLDMQRLGAHEQLRRYAEILDIPLHTAQTISQVKECLKTPGSTDILLIDTPGVGSREEGRFARLATLLRAAQPDNIQLVLPASLAEDVLVRLAHGFSPLKPTGLVLTRLDDVVGFGVILNIVRRVSLRLTYLTAGQNVPNDIEECCNERLVELVLPPSRGGAGSGPV